VVDASAALLVFVLLWAPSLGITRVSAQGVSGAALAGRITADRQPVLDARVTLTDQSTGTSFAVITGPSGHYAFETLLPGSYRLQVVAIGFERSSDRTVTLAVGQRLALDIPLGASAYELPDLSVEGARIGGSASGGPSVVVSQATIERLPLLDRDLARLLDANPYALPGRTGGFAISGQGSRFNAVRVDGGIANDPFGLSPAGTPGSTAGGRAISLEAVREFQVAVAPFDVRLGDFSGGLINLVTRSGTNQFEGSVFGEVQRPGLVGHDTAGAPVSTFRLDQIGARVGGPIVRDRLHFLAVVDLESRRTPFAGPAGSDPRGVSAATAERIRRAVIDNFGFDPGGTEAPVLRQPDRNWFGKLTWQPGRRHVVELSHNRVNAELDDLGRTNINQADRDGWQLSSSGSRVQSRAAATRLRAVSTLPWGSNELLLGHQVLDDDAVLARKVPLYLVQADLPGTYVAAGSVKNGETSLHQRIIELTDNVTAPWRAHQLTAGVQTQLFDFRDDIFPGSLGVWTFDSAAALEARSPSRYEVALPLRPGGPLADFGLRQVGVYLQDRWSPLRRAELTVGLRWDVPFADRPATNAELAGSAALGHIDTGRFPSGRGVLSPRLGVRVNADRRTIVRGGIGAFTGRPPMAWLAQAFHNTGLDQVTVICTAPGMIPPPVSDVANLPSDCGIPGSVPPAAVSYFDPRFRFPQTVKLAAGVDRDLGARWTASIDMVRTWARNQLYLEDVNLIPGTADQEGRLHYLFRRDDRFTAVYRHSNRSADRSVAATLRIEKRFARAYASAGYTWSRTRDLLNTLNSSDPLILRNTPLDGSLGDRNLRTSGLDVPHRVALSGWTDLPAGFGLALIYTARAGTPYAYVLNGDANADAITLNDLVYVPRDASDILLTDPSRYPELERFIASEPCLVRQRGRIMARNTCRNPWITSLDMRLDKGWSLAGRRMALTVDIFNLPHLLNGDWGLVRQTARLEGVTLLRLAGFDETAGRSRYALSALPERRQILTEESRWRIQLGGRLGF
jgi:hypothetical protein